MATGIVLIAVGLAIFLRAVTGRLPGRLLDLAESDTPAAARAPAIRDAVIGGGDRVPRPPRTDLPRLDSVEPDMMGVDPQELFTDLIEAVSE